MKIGEVAARLDLSVSTIRYWSQDRDYARYLSDGAGGEKAGATRDYSEDDAHVILTIQRLRSDGLTKEQIVEALAAGKRVDEALPEPPSPQEEEARKAIALVPMSQLERALDAVKAKHEDLERAWYERAELLSALERQGHAGQEQV